MTISDLNERRRAAAGGGYEGIVCRCGEAWFELRPGPTAPTAAVCLGEDGAVTGYAGVPHCVSCGMAVTVA
jgi:hypothetical protein